MLQLGWESFGTQNCIIRGIDVIGAEWYWVPGKDNATAGDHGNNAVISLQVRVTASAAAML